MKTLIKSLMLILCIMSICAQKSRAQSSGTTNTEDTVTVQPEQVSYYRNVLHSDSIKATQVARIQTRYKAALNRLTLQGLPDDQLGVKIKEIMFEKNRRLKLVLTTDEQKMIIPTTELQQDTTEGGSSSVNRQ